MRLPLLSSIFARKPIDNIVSNKKRAALAKCQGSFFYNLKQNERGFAIGLLQIRSDGSGLILGNDEFIDVVADGIGEAGAKAKESINKVRVELRSSSLF